MSASQFCMSPWLADHWGWTASLLVAAGIALCGGLRWMQVDPIQMMKEGER